MRTHVRSLAPHVPHPSHGGIVQSMAVAGCTHPVCAANSANSHDTMADMELLREPCADTHG